MTAEPQLHVVDPETGELRAPGCASCGELTVKLAASDADLEVVQAENVRLLRRIKALQRDRDAARVADPQRETILELFAYWQEKCGHPRSRFDGSRHDLIKTALRRFSADEIRQAIDGAAVGAFVDQKGTRHDGLGLILRDAEHIERFANKWHRWMKRQAV